MSKTKRVQRSFLLLFLSVVLFWGSLFLLRPFIYHKALESQVQTLSETMTPWQKEWKKVQQGLLPATIKNKEMTLLFLDKNRKSKDNNADLANSSQKEFTALSHQQKVGYHYDTKNKTLFVAKPIYNQKQQKVGYIEVIQKKIPSFHLLDQIFHWLFFFATLFTVIVFYLFYYHKKKREELLSTIHQWIQKIKEEPTKQPSLFYRYSEWTPLFQDIETLSSSWQEERKKADAEAIQFSSLIDDLQVGVFVLDAKQRFTLINPRGKSLLHLQKKNQHYLEAQVNPDFIRSVEQCYQKQKDIQKEIHIFQPQEQILHLSLRYLSNQEHYWILGTIYDLTDLKKVELMQEDFISNVSHELKTPVTSIIGFIETLLDGAYLEPEITKEFLTIMEKDAQRLKQLIQEIIQLSRSGNELKNETKVPVHLSSFIEHLLERYQRQIDENHLQVSVQGDSTIEWSTYLYYFEPILKNLIENAVMYNKEYGKIEIQFKETAKAIKISVADTGIGISHQDQQRIFERFYRVDKARSRNSGGTGLGLSIVRHYTEILKGTLTVKSQIGVGTTFSLTFPKEKASS